MVPSLICLTHAVQKCLPCVSPRPAPRRQRTAKVCPCQVQAQSASKSNPGACAPRVGAAHRADTAHARAPRAQAKVAAYTAAGAAARAAAATLASLDKVTAMYTSTRQYYMLDDLAETSTQAKRVRIFDNAISAMMRDLYVLR